MIMTASKGFRILSNGRLRSHVLPGGQGGLFHDWVALTRYSEADPITCGPMLYLREGNDWVLADDEKNLPDLTVSIEFGIAADRDVEIRKITLSNSSNRVREIELTTYAEIALNHPLGDAGHPAFSKLFVQTSVKGNVLLARRRPRGMNEHWPWLVQTLVGDDANLSWETNRATFLGRGRSPFDAAAMDRPGELGGGTGNVLDPVMAFRSILKIPAKGAATAWILTGAAADENSALDLIGNCRSPRAVEKLLEDANAAAISRAEALNVSAADAIRYQALVGKMLLGREDRAVPQTLVGSAAVHRFPLSWEEIRVIATTGWDAAGTRDMLAALPFWKSLGLQVRLFVMDASTRDTLPEGVVLTDPASLTAEETTWWLASAQLVVGADIMHADALKRPSCRTASIAAPAHDTFVVQEALQCTNSYGGFSADGREYVIHLPLENGRLRRPPMPWVNVLANPDFGCLVSEAGASCTWSRNSQANRLTPWSNDPIRDPYCEALYLLDCHSGERWSPLPGPCPPRSEFTVRHGFGRTRFMSVVDGIFQTVETIVAIDAPVKLVSVHLKNHGKAARRLLFSAYQQLTLCSSPDRHHAVLAWTDPDGIQHAVNPRAGDFAGGRAFSFVAIHGAEILERDSNNSSSAFFGDGGIAAPDALWAGLWKNEKGYGRDACFSEKISFELPPGDEIEIVIGLGEAMSEAEEKKIIARFIQSGAVRTANEEIDAQWHDLLDRVQIKTPMPEVDLMVNGWLTYQNLACRIWGRTAFFQSGGAYGFRDQLQDSGALAALHPEIMRAQILLHAAQQFPEGDVTHWWHPAPMDRGMRTKFSDDLLWLPYLTDHYLEVTGDESVLGESRSFIGGPLLKPGEDEEYMKPERSANGATVFEHCCLSIDRSLTAGAHGLPLMGIGDWNDGMSRVGREGRGESVWMAFFLYTILNRWIPLCKARGENTRAANYEAYRSKLLIAINSTGWDGEWYRRAYYDDGTPLGTHTDDECRIDALAQAWAVISKAAPPDRAAMALDSLQRELIDPEHDIIRLLDPPFVNTPHDPGYIKGYVAGVRENGGQYTHAACWVVRAMAEAGRRDEAAKLLQRLSPIWHSRDANAVALYQVEPYVVAADIYGAAPHVGRGGWTWYTGSAGWMFRVAVESVLGLRMEDGNTVLLDPRIPDDWVGFSVEYRPLKGTTLHRIQVTVSGGNAAAVTGVTVDGKSLAPSDSMARWPFVDDGRVHQIEVTLGVSPL